MTSMVRKSLPLTQEEWENLEELAQKLQVLSPTGPSFGKPSWRSLIKAIANGDLLVVSQETTINTLFGVG